MPAPNNRRPEHVPLCGMLALLLECGGCLLVEALVEWLLFVLRLVLEALILPVCAWRDVREACDAGPEKTGPTLGQYLLRPPE